jgi:YVTN family beta-propeller protein
MTCFFAPLVGSLAIALGSAPSSAQNAYIPNGGVLVIDTATNTVVGRILVDAFPVGVAVTPDGSKVYVRHTLVNTVSVIDTATDTVTAKILAGNELYEITGGLAVTPDGNNVDVVTTNRYDGTSTVSVIDTATNTVVGLPIPVGPDASGIAVTPDGSKVYVVGNPVSAIDAATNTVVAVLPVGGDAFGVFIQPRFAGTIRDANCYGQSISALAS